MSFRTGLMIACLLLWAVPVLAAPTAEILEYGYYEFTEEAKRIEHQATTSGYVQKGKARLVEKTTRIPIEKGRLFGFRFRISGVTRTIGVLPLELVVSHPTMTKPDGTVSNGYRYPVHLDLEDGGVVDQTGYSIMQDYEMVEGEWVFQYRFLDSVFMEQRFVTYKPKGSKSEEGKPKQAMIQQTKNMPAETKVTQATTVKATQ